MKKLVISKLFLYKHRFGIGYTILAILFTAGLFFFPLISPNGLSESEMESAVTSYRLDFDSALHGNVIDLPYHALQKASIFLFGLNIYAVKLPSIIIGVLLGILLILLLNRWFKNNVALIASILTVLSSVFLFLAGSGTPLIMLVFWPTLLLWLGSKIQGKTIPKSIYSFIFALCLLLSIFTPYLIYLAAFILFFAVSHPHLRFTIKKLPKIPLVLTTMIIVGGLTVILINIFTYPDTALALFFMPDFSFGHFFANIKDGFMPFLAWSGKIDNAMLSPMVGLASLVIAITGLLSTAKGFFASRNSIASLLIVFTVILTGFNPNSAVLIILPLSILIAHGIRYILEKWYGLFPENPYARIFGLLPITAFMSIIIISSLSHFVFGYRYNPPVADNFITDLTLIQKNLEPGTTLLVTGGTLEYDFYKILEDHSDLIVTSTPPDDNITLATLGRWPSKLPYQLQRIITSSKSSNSDRIYIYTK